LKPERYAHVLSFALSHPWAVTPEFMPMIAGILARHIAGQDSSAEVAAALVNRKNLPQPRAGSLAIIPIYGVIAPRMNLFSEYSGGTTFQKLSGQLREAVANADVKTIVFDIDSPGSTVAGCPEFVDELLRARAKKPIVAVGNYMMASGAYHIASACTEIVASKSTITGSIGVVWMHDDLSEALKQFGINRTFTVAGEGKIDGNETQPLSDAVKARRQATIDSMYGQFVTNVVNGRGGKVTDAKVRAEWKAYVYESPDALALGMIDSIATLDETITRLLSASPDPADQRAALDYASTPTSDTPQEPAQATGQDRQSDAQWQNGIDAELLALEL
jgi:signal peptide peptidase SppA